MHKKKWLSVLIGTIIGTMSLPASVFAADSATALPKTEGKPRLLVITGRGSGRYEHINSYAALF